MNHDPSGTPRPETAGSLREPPRLPPTAVGLLTPPPARDPRARRSWPLSRTRLIAVAMLGGIFVAAGPLAMLAMPSVGGAVVGGGSVLLGGGVWWRLARLVRRAHLVGGSLRYAGSSRPGRRAA